MEVIRTEYVLLMLLIKFYIYSQDKPNLRLVLYYCIIYLKILMLGDTLQSLFYRIRKNLLLQEKKKE